VSAIKQQPVMIGAKEAQTKLPKFWIVARKRRLQGRHGLNQAPSGVSREIVKEKRHTNPNAAPLRRRCTAPATYTWQKESSRNQKSSVALDRCNTTADKKIAITPLRSIPAAPQAKGMMAIVPVAATLM